MLTLAPCLTGGDDSQSCKTPGAADTGSSHLPVGCWGAALPRLSYKTAVSYYESKGVRQKSGTAKLYQLNSHQKREERGLAPSRT